jgi:hypothetical protein
MKKLIKQSDSKNSFIREGSDWNGSKFSNKLITLSLELETWINENPKYTIDDSWSDYQPSYIISGVRKNPIENESGWRKTHYSILEVFPRVVGKGGYYIRDYRVLSPNKNRLFSEKVYNLEELITEIERKDYGVDVSEYMRIKGIKSHNGIISESDIDELKNIIL